LGPKKKKELLERKIGGKKSKIGAALRWPDHHCSARSGPANNHALCDQQHGFHKRKSCKTQLISTVNEFAECLNQGGQCDILLLDFSKAFDKVSHSLLYHKLPHYGIQGSILSWLASFLSRRSQYVMLDNQK